MPNYNTKYGVIEIHNGYTLIGYEAAIIRALIAEFDYSEEEAHEAVNSLPLLLKYWRQNFMPSSVAGGIFDKKEVE